MESESVVRNAVAQPIIRVVARNGDAFVHLDSSLGPAIHYKVKGASMAEFFTNWIRFVRDKSIKLANIGIYWTANAEAALEYLLRIAHALHWKTRNRIVKEMFGEGIGVWLFAAKVMERLGGNHSIFTEDYANRWIQRLLGDKANTDITTIQNWWIIGVIFQYKCLRVIPVKDRISMILQNDCTRRRFQDWVDPQGRPLSRPRETAVYDSMIREYLGKSCAVQQRINLSPSVL
jgi:hypothetical protein